MTYLTRVSLDTGHLRRIERQEVGEPAIALLRPWLAELAASGERRPLPVPALAHYSASAVVEVGLVVTIWAPQGPHRPGAPALAGSGIPLVTLGVAQRSRQGRDLWAALVAQLGADEAARRPAEPWLAVKRYPSSRAFPDAFAWLGDLEACIAWAWITLRPEVGAAS